MSQPTRPQSEHTLCSNVMPFKWSQSCSLNDINNQQDATMFSFINLLKSAQHVSGNKFAHAQEHSSCLYIQLLVHCTDTAADRCHGWGGTPSQLWHRLTAVSVHCTKSCIYNQKECSWGWANLLPETCRADLKRLINEKVVASCWLVVCVVLMMHGHKNILFLFTSWRPTVQQRCSSTLS